MPAHFGSRESSKVIDDGRYDYEEEDDAFMELSNADLDALFAEAEAENAVLEKENEMFGKYLHRVEPHIGRLDTEEELPAPSSGSRLTAEQKCDVAARELEEIREEIEEVKDESERVIDNFRAVMEECDIRLAELKKAAYEFKRDIVQGGVNPRTNKIIAEKVVRHFEDKLRSRDTLIEKLRLKNATLKVQKNKLHLQLRQKEEMGEVLHAIDFDQLKIENKQYQEKIEERNQELLRLKLTAGTTLGKLNTHKKKLHSLTQESARLKSEIAQREELYAKIDAESEVVEAERGKAEKLNVRLRKQLDDFKVPDVLEYVEVKHEQHDLIKMTKNWERKVEIANMALKKQKKLWNQVLAANGTSSAWEG